MIVLESIAFLNFLKSGSMVSETIGIFLTSMPRRCPALSKPT